MATDRLFSQQYTCSNCNLIQKHFTWTSDITKDTVNHCCINSDCRHNITAEDMSFADTEDVSLTIINGKMSKEEIRKDRKARSRNHFQKEVMPYLPKEQQLGLMAHGLRNK